ncbi:MAG: hypothetical protein HDR83_07615 [Bacteroides sp.]|nr:hypothetical protein [Bacteroidales bacterium]MBD5250342.1 hypothetical protein [Barnesiella sp.]MBD5254266.1 hypothetical protein [Barnesiella sp.]MBD5344772.1 hypothetical protein [Bacteroides sp.]MBD5369111.1 hypothetical protein [Bacteroides sp.]
MTTSIIASAIMWVAIAGTVAAITLIGASISHVRSLLALRRQPVAVGVSRSDHDHTR